MDDPFLVSFGLGGLYLALKFRRLPSVPQSGHRGQKLRPVGLILRRSLRPVPRRYQSPRLFVQEVHQFGRGVVPTLLTKPADRRRHPLVARIGQDFLHPGLDQGSPAGRVVDHGGHQPLLHRGRLFAPKSLK